MWMWFATMYLTHHYLIDLVGGSIYATLAFFAFRPQLPEIRSDCLTRLDYVDVKVPVKRSISNFVRSIEMEKFKEWLELHASDDTEMLINYVPAIHEEQDTIPLRPVKKNLFIIPNAGTSSSGSLSSSPISSGPPSPVTPRFDVFPQPELKHSTFSIPAVV